MNNVTVVPKEDQIYGIRKRQSKSVSSYLTQAKNSYGQEAILYVDSLMNLSIPPSISSSCSILIASYPFTHHLYKVF